MIETPTAQLQGRFVSFSLAKAAIVIGGYSFVNLVVGLIRGKISAALLGTAGVGVLAQASNFVAVAAVLCALGFAAGITNRLAAEAKSGRNEIGYVVASTAFTVQLSVTAAFILGALLLFQPLYYTLFAVKGVEWPFIIVLLGLPLTVAPTGVVDPVFFGVGRYDLYTKASVASVVLGVLPFLALTYLWGVEGAIISIVAAAALRFLTFLYYGAQLGSLKRLFRLTLHAPALKHLFGFGWTTFIVAVIGGAVSVLIRSRILHVQGPADNGLYQVPVAFSAYCVPFLSNGLWGHLYPFVSGHSEAEARSEVERALRMNIVAVAALVFGLVLLQEWAIALVFSREFLPATRFMPLQVFGDLFYIPALTLSVVLLGLGRLKQYVRVWVGYHLVQGVMVFLLLPVFGLVGAALAYTMSTVAFLALAWAAYIRGSDGRILQSDLFWLMGVSAALLAAEVAVSIVWSTQWWLRIIPLGTWVLFMAMRPEVAELLGWGVSRGRRLRRALSGNPASVQ